MIFPFRKVIDFAMTNPIEVDKAYVQIFGSLPPNELKTEWEELFLEWLIHDYKPSNGISFLMQYVLKNPDNLDEGMLNQFEQIVQTQFYSQFEILEIKRGQWIRVEDLFTGKAYKVYEKKGSESLSGKGIIPGRLAKVDNKWYLIGANSVYFPITYTERAKKNMRQLKIRNYSPKDTIELLRSQDKMDLKPIKIPTKKELKEKRKKLEEDYREVYEKFGVTLLFKDLIDAVYNEDRDNYLNFWESFEEKGLHLEVIIENTQLFEDIWNYFPHKCINGFSPIELLTKMNKES